MLFTAGGIATPADAAMMMQLGAEGVFVGSGIFKSGNPAERAAAIVKATTFFDDADVIAKVSPRARRGDGRHQRRRHPAAAPAGRARLVTRPLVGVLAVQGNVGEHAAMLDAAGADTRPVRRPEDLNGLAGLVLPGGESTTIDKLTRRYGLVEPIRAALGAGLPVLGTCAGMILLADRIVGGTTDQQSIGGLDVVVRRNAFGRQVDSFETDLTVTGLDAPFRGVFIRAPWVEQVGPGVEVLATVESGPAAGHVVAVRQGDIVATSFHPELSGDPRLHAYVVGLVRA